MSWGEKGSLERERNKIEEQIKELNQRRKEIIVLQRKFRKKPKKKGFW